MNTKKILYAITLALATYAGAADVNAPGANPNSPGINPAPNAAAPGANPTANTPDPAAQPTQGAIGTEPVTQLTKLQEAEMAVTNAQQTYTLAVEREGAKSKAAKDAKKKLDIAQKDLDVQRAEAKKQQKLIEGQPNL